MRLLDVCLTCARSVLPTMRGFYGDTLGLRVRDDASRCASPLRGHPGFEAAVGHTTLGFVPADGSPFHHFAMLVPGDRFAAAVAWADERVDLLPILDSRDRVIEFENWDASACYFHDPAGNIVELIAHRGHGTRPDRKGAAFAAGELLGLSEIGLVGDVAALAADFERLGLRPFQGEPAAGALAFLGEPTGTLILAPEGRGWLPTGRPAEPWPVTVTADTAGAAVDAGLGPHRVTFRD